MLSKNELSEIATQCEELEASPWMVTSGDREGEYVLLNANHYRIASSVPNVENMEHDPESLLNFCASARSIIPKLIAHIQALEEKLSDASLDSG